MIRNLIKKIFGLQEIQEQEESKGIFSTHIFDGQGERKIRITEYIQEKMNDLWNSRPKPVSVEGQAMDSEESGGMDLKAGFGLTQPTISEALTMWYISQSFIGHQMCAFMAQNWLIDKACTMPARDAIRQGYEIISSDENKLETQVLQKIEALNNRYGLNKNLEEFVRFGRIFGIRILFFKIESGDEAYDKEFYEKPFNIDGIKPGSYKGMVQVDPYWTAPWLDGKSASHPDDIHFYEPTWWMINGKRYHRSHLIIFKGSEVADFLKPSYLYGGVPVPQKIMERVYAAERTANEGPLLAMTKRTTVYKTNLEEAYANKELFDENMRSWINWRDNQQIKLADREDEVQQLDTALNDLDEVIMTQYQIVAAAAGVPATKLLGTTPKGFNATGEYEEASYHEELESIQTHDLDPLVNRHHLIMLKSNGMNMRIKIEWNPVDSPTAKEESDINAQKSITLKNLVDIGGIDSYDVRDFLINDKDSGFSFLEVVERPEELLELEPPEKPAPFGQDES